MLRMKRYLCAFLLTVTCVGFISGCTSKTTQKPVRLTSAESETDTTKPAYLLASVKAWGARGDGKTDDTEAIRKAVAEAPLGGTLFFPVGHYRVSGQITINRPITLRGEGTDFYYWGRFGDPYQNINDPGSVIETTASDGVLIDHTPPPDVYATLKVETLHLKGIGDASRTITGLRIGSGDDWGGYVTLKGLRVANFKTGVQLDGIQGSTIDDTWIVGCDTGLSLGDATVANTFTNFSAGGCGVSVDMAAFKCVFLGGTIQSSLRTGIIVRGEENSFRDIYFESGLGDYAIDVKAGADSTTIDACHLGGSNDNLRIAAAACRVFPTKATRNLDLVYTANATMIYLPWNGSISDNGYRTCFMPPPVAAKASRGIVSISRGKTWVLVPHELSYTPDPADVTLTAVGLLGRATYPVIYGTNPTQLQIGVDRDPGPNGARVAWSVMPK
jgi:hypothetical protein